MHTVKRNARKEAWRETTNPFAHRKRTNSSTNKLERGDLSVHDSVTTGPQMNGGLGDASRVPTERTLVAQPHGVKNQSTSFSGPGYEGEPITMVESPVQTMRESPISSTDTKTDAIQYSEKPQTELVTETSNTGADENHGDTGRKRGFAKFFGGKSEARKESMDDDDNNNGKNKPKFTAMGQIKSTLFNSWINVLLIASPVGIALYYAKVSPVVIFVVNFIAIIPLAAMLSYATEEIALRTGEVIGGLLNASFGNAVELIVSIIALVKDQTLIVQTSLIGSILSNLLLVLGMCFFFGGITRVEQAFNMTVAQTAASLLFLAVSSLIIPTAFEEWANTGTTDATGSNADVNRRVAALSRATSIMLLLVYACYLFFQLKSHAKMYNAPSEKNEKRDLTKQKNWMRRKIPGKRQKSVTSNQDSGDDDEPEEPQLHIWVAIATLAASTVLVALNAEYLVDSINAITCGSNGISKNFVGLILLPIVGNAAEHATAVTVAIKDKMDLAIGVAVGSSMQIALLVLPFVVVLGWIIGKDDMTLYFDGFQIAVLFVAVLLVNYLIQDGKSHWLEGVLLMTLYIIIAVAAWFYPTVPGSSDCPAA